MGIPVLGPDINESVSNFSVNNNGQIRFGMSALKGVGEGPVEAILEERSKNGPFESIFDLTRRLPLQSINKRVLESLGYGGAFDCFENIHRAQYFAPSEKYDSLLEHALKYGNAFQGQKAQAAVSLFGDMQEEIMIPEPEMPDCREWSLLEKLNNEREVTGIYISGHPLDDYRVEIENFVTCSLEQVEHHMHKPQLNLVGLVVTARHMISKNGNGWGIFEIRDYDGSMEFKLFKDDYQKYRHILEEGKALFLKGSFQKGWREDSDMEFKPKEISLLEGVAENLTDSITLRIPVEALTEKWIEHLDKLCKQYKGKHRLRMELLDSTNRLKLEMFSKDRKVLANNEFVAELVKMGVEYRLN